MVAEKAVVPTTSKSRIRPLVVEGASERPGPARMPAAVVRLYPTPESLFRRVENRGAKKSRFRFTRPAQVSDGAWVNRGARDTGLGAAPLEDLGVDPAESGDIGGDGDDVFIYTAARVRYSRELVRRAGYA
ncbi:MAG: hypothetical protein ACYCS7_00580 [Acidimicrobiales bacterium]